MSDKVVAWNKNAPAEAMPEKIVNPTDLIHYWPWIRDRLDVIKKKDPHAGHWVPEHIRHLAMLGLSGASTTEIFIAHRDKTPYAFIVTEIVIDRYIHVPTVLHVWAGWLSRSMIVSYLPFLDGLARQRGVTRITFETGRIGWRGTIEALGEGFVAARVVYQREVR